MKINIDKERFTLYRYAGESNLLVAVPNDYLPFIKQAEEEYGHIKNVPADRTVRGVFIEEGNSNFFDAGAQQSDITINRLE